MKCLYYHIVIWIYRKNKYSGKQAGPFVCRFSQVSITALDICRLMRFFRLLGHAIFTVIRLHVCRFVGGGGEAGGGRTGVIYINFEYDIRRSNKVCYEPGVTRKI